MEKTNIEKIIFDLTAGFFRESDLNEIMESYVSHKEKITLPDSVSNLSYSSTDSNSVKDTIQLLITFAEKKLNRDKLLQFLVTLGQHTIVIGEFTSSVEIHKLIISYCGADDDLSSIRASANVGLAEIYSRQAEWALCKKHIKAAEKIFINIKDFKGAAKCQNLLGTVEGDCGKINAAKKHFEKSLSYLENDPDKALTGMIEINLGIICNIQGNFDEAISFYQRALIGFKKINDIKRIAEIKHNMGMTYLRKKQYELALNEFDQSISASLSAQYMQTLGISYLCKADVYARLGDFRLAAALASKATEICYRTNDRLSIAELYKIKGIIQKNLGKFKIAENYFLTSLRLNKELGNLMNEAETAYELGLLYKEIKSKKESEIQLEKALHYYKKIKADKDVSEIRTYLPN